MTKETKEMQELVPQLQVIHISEAGHNKFTFYIEAISAFLTQEYKGS